MIFNNTADLLKQIAIGEDSVLGFKTIEFKGNQVAGPHRNSMADELAAMANTATGVILLGVDDKSKAIIGEAIGVRPTQLTIKQSALQKFRPSYDLFQNLHEC